MRLFLCGLTMLAGASLLGGCGGKSQPAAGAAPSEAAAPAPPTADQAKAIVAALPAPYNAADLENGKHQVAVCRSCHTLVQDGPNMTGPNLYGVLGRKAGSVAGFGYSDGMKAAGWTWDLPHLDTWLTDPRAMVAGTRMTFYGIRNAKDRADAIAYLMTQTRPAGK